LNDEPEKEVTRSIRLPQKVWDVLESDAKRCKRSAVKQLEALLSKWYGLDDVEIQFEMSAGVPHYEKDKEQGERS